MTPDSFTVRGGWRVRVGDRISPAPGVVVYGNLVGEGTGTAFGPNGEILHGVPTPCGTLDCSQPLTVRRIVWSRSWKAKDQFSISTCSVTLADHAGACEHVLVQDGSGWQRVEPDGTVR